MITNFLVARKAIRKFIQKYQTVFELLFKFIITYVAYDQITQSLNFSETLTKSILKLGIAGVGAFVPEIVTILLLGLVSLYEVYSAAPILAAFVLVLFVVIYCFAARFSGKYAYAIIAIPILFKFNLQYIIPLLLGLTASPLAMFPAACGVMFYYIFKVIVSAVSISNLENLDEALALYIKVIDDILSNKDMIFTIGIFAGVILVMWLVRRLQFSFAFELTIITGACACLIGHFLAYLKLDFPIDGVVSGTIIATLIVAFVQFFRLILDYTGVQDVQFEDDDYYYYVKAVPKVDIDIPNHFVKKGEAPHKPEKEPKPENAVKAEAPEQKETKKNGQSAKDFFAGIGTAIAAAFATVHENFKKLNSSVKEKMNKPSENSKPEKVIEDSDKNTKKQETPKDNSLSALNWDEFDDEEDSAEEEEADEKDNE